MLRLIKKLTLLMVFFVPQFASAETIKTSKNNDVTPPKILIVMTNHSQYPSREDKTGLWLTELTHFFDIAQSAGLSMDFVSPLGGNIPLDERSLSWLYTDKAARKHLQDPIFMALLKQTKAVSEINSNEYQAIYFTGGHGVMWDFRNNQSLKKLAESIYQQGGVVSAVCHGVAGLLSLQDANGKSLLANRKITGFSNTEELLSGIKSQVPFFLEDEISAAGAYYQKGIIPFTSFVLTDGQIVTGQNPNSSKAVAKAVVQLLLPQP